MHGHLRPCVIAFLAMISATPLAACGGGATAAPSGPSAHRFDADRAFAELRAQVGMGPRPAGSATSRRLAARLRAELPHGRYEGVPGGLRNVIGRLPGSGAPILIGAHYDTKDIPGFVGANDGAGGTAVVVQLARDLARGRRACQRQVRFALFDGEESPAGSSDFLADGLRGSGIHAARHAAEYRAMVLLDFVADRSLRIPREASSDAGLWSGLRASARAVGAGAAFPDLTGPLIYDDHTPFQRAGVPSIDLIDWDYPYFHSRADTLDKVSAASLDMVGETLVPFIDQLRNETCGS
jgi:glutaminyl-peptide cyclotransferase